MLLTKKNLSFFAIFTNFLTILIVFDKYSLIFFYLDLTNELRARENEIKDTDILVEAKESELSFLRKRIENAQEAISRICSDRKKSIEQCNTIAKQLSNIDQEIDSSRSESIDRVLNLL